MSDKDIIHGAKVWDDETSLEPIQTPSLGQGVIVGTMIEASIDDFPYNKPIQIVKGGSALEKIGNSGTAVDAIKAAIANSDAVNYIIRVEHNEDAQIVINNILGDKALKTGIYALETIQNIYGQKAHKICVPFYTSIPVGVNNANPIITALIEPTFADENRLQIYADVDCPTLEVATNIRKNYDSDRLHLCGTPVWVYDKTTTATTQKPYSPYVMGVNQWCLINRGPQKNLSNMPIAGIMGPVYEYSHRFNSNNCETSLLNQQDIIVIIRNNEGGYRTWGNTTATSEDENKFGNIRQVIDYLSIGIEDYLINHIDEVPSHKFFDDLEHEINENLIKPAYAGNNGDKNAPEPMLVGGFSSNRFYFERSLNTVAKARNGVWWWKLKCEPVSVLSGLNVQIERSPEGYQEFFDVIAG